MTIRDDVDLDNGKYANQMPVPNKRREKQPPQSQDSPEEINKKRAERAAKRLAEIQELNDHIEISGNRNVSRAGFAARSLLSLAGLSGGGSTLKIMTWNILAQCLVKRDLFPGCAGILRWSQRGPLPTREIAFYSPDLVALQEVDRVGDHAAPLQDAGYDYRWEGGETIKLHGLLIAWKRNLFRKEGERVALMDKLAFSSEPDKPDGQRGRQRTGLSRVTRNVGLAVALSYAGQPTKGIILATHHLFWHARYTYERARQTGLWLREVRDFRRSKPEWMDWPLVFAGDFNTQPFEPTYRLLIGAPLMPRHFDMISNSRVVHFTVDNLAKDECAFPFGRAARAPPAGDEYEGGQETAPIYSDEVGDEDRALKACRPATAQDGLLSDDELASLFVDEVTGQCLGLESAYGSHYGTFREAHRVECFDGRPPDEGLDSSVFDGVGADEPRWTSITPLWRCTLDYLFTLPGEGPHRLRLGVVGLLPMHKTIECEPGLPRADVCSSDHMALMAEFRFDAVDT